MADKSISELTAATQVGSTDLFVLEQSGVAKKLTGQILENWLVALADGHGGIQDIEKTSTSGLIDTYTITLADETVETFTVTNGKAISSVVKTGAVPPSLTDSYRINYNDGTHYDFTVTNGKGVTSIEKTSTSGLVDTYTITYNDSTTGTITVTNGKAITSITDKWAVSSSNTQTPSTWYNAAPEMTPTNRYLWHYQVIAYNDNTSVDTTKAVVGVYGDTGDAWYMWIKYAANEPTQDSDMVTIPNKWIGIYSGTSSTAPVHYTSYDWYEYKGEKGDTGDAAEVTSTAIVYQASESGTTVPTGTWVDTVPTVVQGQFLWTRVTVNWNDGTSAVWYSVSYVAIDGEGSPGSQTPLVDSGSGVVGTATAYSRQDHQHPLNVPSSGEPAMDGTASRGNADTYSRSDHIHPTDTSRARVADMAAAYSQRTYAKGELCIYENVLYRCKDGISTAEAWNSSHWETTNIGVELGDLNGAVNGLDAYIRNKKIAIFGDSWSDEDIQWSTTVNDVWVKTFRTLCSPYNATITNYSRSSRGWCRKDNRNQYTGLEIIANTDLTNIDTVILFMGLNDFLNAVWVGNYNTENTNRMWYALNQSVQYLTGKNVFVITPFAVSTYGSLKCATAELYRIVLANWATQNGYMLINGTTCPQCGKGSSVYETSHIKNAYHPIIAQHIFSKILQGGEPYNEMTEIASFVPSNPTITNITTVNEIAVQYHRNTIEVMVDVDITAENATASIQAPIPYISKFWQRYITINFNNHMMRTSMNGSEGGNDQSPPLCSYYFADASSGAYTGTARAQLCGAGYSTILGKPN